MPLDDVASKMESMDEDEFEAYLEDLAKDIDLSSDDSDMPENVIKFKPRSTVH